VSEFVLELPGGEKSLIENSRDLCKSTSRATVEFTGQNGKAAHSRPVVVPQCPAKLKPKKAKKKKKHHKKKAAKPKGHKAPKQHAKH
jgi:hypothetical protein